MVLKLYCGSRPTGGGGIVAMVLAEKQIPFEHVLVDLGKGEHKTPEFLQLQPFGLIPVIDDDGFILYESRAICRYLAEKYADQGTPLLPTGLREKAIFEQGASIEFANFYPLMLKLANEIFYKRNSGLPKDEVAIAGFVSELSAKLDAYEVILGKQKFLGGDNLTLADLFHLSFMPFLETMGIDIMQTKGPNITRWWNELISRPTWLKLRADGIQGTAS
ncbi:glutathione S-transferase [Mycena leptocephala]|nr:glutathione S-transferase [Mycena leptocephala]